MNERLLRGMGMGIIAAPTLVACPAVAPQVPIGGRRPRNGHDGGHRSRS